MRPPCFWNHCLRFLQTRWIRLANYVPPCCMVMASSRLTGPLTTSRISSARSLYRYFNEGLVLCISKYFLRFIGYTRISDFQHHWYDVLTGAVVGSLIAFFAFKFILDWHQYSPRFLPYTAGNQSQIPPVFQPRFGSLRPRLPFGARRVRNCPWREKYLKICL